MFWFVYVFYSQIKIGFLKEVNVLGFLTIIYLPKYLCDMSIFDFIYSNLSQNRLKRKYAIKIILEPIALAPIPIFIQQSEQLYVHQSNET